MKIVKVLMIAAIVFALVGRLSFAEDIELYVGSIDQRTGQKPQVLIIFDNSGSMNGTMTIQSSYDPNGTYSAIGGSALNDEYVYYSKSTSSIPEPTTDESRKFLKVMNGCNTAVKQVKYLRNLYRSFTSVYVLVAFGSFSSTTELAWLALRPQV